MNSDKAKQMIHQMRHDLEVETTCDFYVTAQEIPYGKAAGNFSIWMRGRGGPVYLGTFVSKTDAEAYVMWRSGGLDRIREGERMFELGRQHERKVQNKEGGVTQRHERTSAPTFEEQMQAIQRGLH